MDWHRPGGPARHHARRAALRLGPRRPSRARHLDRPRTRPARREPAAPILPRLDDPLLRPRDRRLALDMERTGQRPRPTLHHHRSTRARRHQSCFSDRGNPQLRWRFTDIAPGSFRWRAEISRDACATWSFDQQMLAAAPRRAAPRRAAPRRLEPSSVGGGCRPDADSTRRRPARDRTDTTGSQR